MNRRSFSLGLLAAAAMGAAPTVLTPRASAQEGTVLRLATITPRGSTWHRVFTAWGNTLRTQTGGRLSLQVVNVGAGDELDVVRRLRAGELDGAALTTLGLGQIARSVLVLQAPGLFETDAALDRARATLDAELRRTFHESGTELLGWSDYGQGRIFSTRPIASPADLAQARPWLVDTDVMFVEMLRAVGGSGGVPLPIAGVRAALEDGRIDTVVASATVVSAMQWNARLTHVTAASSAPLLGATLFSKARFDALAPDLQQALRDTGRQAHDTLMRTVRREDARYFETLVARQGLTSVDATPHAAAWRRAAEQARSRLVGRIYSQEQLDRATAAAR